MTAAEGKEAERREEKGGEEDSAQILGVILKGGKQGEGSKIESFGSLKIKSELVDL